MRRQCPTLGRKLAGGFLPKVGEGKNHTLYIRTDGVSPWGYKVWFSLQKRGAGNFLYDS